MEKFFSGCENFGLTINIKKSEVLDQPNSVTFYHELYKTGKGQKLKSVEYLNSTFSHSLHFFTRFQHGNNIFFKASGAFGRFTDKRNYSGH